MQPDTQRQAEKSSMKPFYGRRISVSGRKGREDSIHRKESVRGTWEGTGRDGYAAGIGPSESHNHVPNPSVPVISSCHLSHVRHGLLGAWIQEVKKTRTSLITQGFTVKLRNRGLPLFHIALAGKKES